MATKSTRRAAVSLDNEPVSSIEWVHRDTLHANAYNPNHVAPPELKLLAQSIVEDGWTQPIVARSDGEIVDGFHRWTISALQPLLDLYGGMVPVCYLRADTPIEQQMMATIRHNRARGMHGVVPMADIVRQLVDSGISIEDLRKRLQMDEEEVDRLYDRGGMTKRGARESFNNGWKPGNEGDKE